MVTNRSTSKAFLSFFMFLSRLMATRGLLGSHIVRHRSSHHRLLMNRSTRAATGPGGSFDKEKLLVLGGTGFLGQEICKRATLDGYAVTSLSRRGLPPSNSKTGADSVIDYRQGDATNIDSITNILNEGGYTAVIHCIGLLFDDSSGLGQYNVFVSGSGSVPNKGSTYDSITRLTAFNAIDATVDHAKRKGVDSFPFIFTSAAEAGWPDVTFGQGIEKYLTPEWLRRYLKAKREVEAKLLNSAPALRPVIVRPSLIYSMDRPASFVPVGAFFIGNSLKLPFVDRPVTVSSLATAMVRATRSSTTSSILRYPQIEELSSF